MTLRCFIVVFSAAVALGPATAQVPIIQAVVNSATFGTEVSPGVVSQVFGQNLSAATAPCTADEATIFLPTTLCAARVFVNNKPSPLILVTQSHITFQFSPDLDLGQAEVVVEVQDRRSSPFPVSISRYSPGLFTKNNSGVGSGTFLVAGKVVSEENPSHPGTLVTGFATGLGPTVPIVPAGEIPPADFRAVTAVLPSLFVGRNPALVNSSALSFMPGIYEVEFVVPWSQEQGTQSVILTIGESVSNVVTIPIGPRPSVINPEAAALTNAASFIATKVANEAWYDLWGTSLGYFLALDSAFPALLDGTSAELTDSAGVQRPARLHFVSWGRIQLLTPPGMARGPGSLTITNSTGGKVALNIEVAPVAPGIFSANSSGQGPAAATWLKVAGDGSRTSGFAVDLGNGGFVNDPIDLGVEADQVYISFFGTGFRNQTSVGCRIGGIDAPVFGAVAQGQFLGLDQAVVGPIPRSLAGRQDADVEFFFDDIPANIVTVSFQ